MQGNNLKVLMWKHLRVRMRRFIHTPVEVLSTASFFVLLFLLKQYINPLPPTQALTESNRIEQTELFALNRVQKPSLIYYYPDTDLTGLLMDAVGKKLSHTRLQSVPAYGQPRGYIPLSNETEIADLKLAPSQALVILQNMTSGDWPKNLNYTIRMKELFNTYSIEPYDGKLKPHSGFGSRYETFMTLQWTIDTSYIKMVTDKDITQKVTFQEFPYYRATDNEVVAHITLALDTICPLSLMLVFVFLVSRLLEERATGIQELTKMVGVSSNTLGISHFLNVLPAGAVYAVIGAVLLKVTSNPFIPITNGGYIFLVLILHFITVVSMAFACSYLAKSTQYSVTISLFSYVALWMPASLVSKYSLSPALVALTGVLPHAPVKWFWAEVGALEQYGEGLTLSSMMESHTQQSASVFLGYLMMLAQTALFFSLAWYLSLVRPGNYGNALPWNFLFQKQYWSKNEVRPRIESEPDEEEPIAQNKQYFEPPPNDMDAGIKIVNVSKMFPKHKALSNVNLEVYKGEITVLLGHNGAGKTTLMSIITGMIGATEGKVYVNGMDNVSRQEEVRKHLGLCPQHNLFFADLTVFEHVMFFTLLKGVTFQEARASSRKLLESLGIHEKADSQSRDLSGGMKRRLQLACALAGDADVLILDEPTSGLDVETRRELWDLLLSLRGSRTVLLTTHFMEEAEALGDRVAALHHGQLTCHATTMHLKKAIGTGYRLSFTTIGAPHEQAITSLVTSHIPDATLKDKTPNSLSYNLPAARSENFTKLFSALEFKRSELGIDSIGVGISTLEEVFLKLCSDVDISLSDDETDSAVPEPQYRRVTGIPLYVRQMMVLFRRQVKYLMSKKISFLILQVILPIIMLVVFTLTFNNSGFEEERTNKMIALNLDLYKGMPEKRVLYKLDVEGISLRSISDLYPKVDFQMTSDVADATLRSAKESLLEYNKYLVGIELNDTDAKILFTTTVRHAAPVALNLLSNVLAGRGDAVTTLNYPVEQMARYSDSKFLQPKNFIGCFMWAIFIVFIILATNINAVSLPCKERVSGSRHIYVMSGCPPELHWTTTLIFHTVVCAIVLVVPTVVIAATVDTDHTFNQVDFLFTLMFILILGCMCFFAFMYVVSFYFSERAAGIVLVAFVIVFGVLTVTTKSAADMVAPDSEQGFTYYVPLISNYVMPPHTLVTAVLKATRVARLNAYCELNKDKCPLRGMDDSAFNGVMCCAGVKECYFCLNKLGVAQEVIILAVQFSVLMCVVLLAQRGYFNLVWDKILNSRYRAAAHADAPERVRAEAAYVSKAITLPNDQIKDAMLVDNVHKNYPRVFSKSCNAVKGISFSVKKGECFGLLGVNGAGKSTTFKMLTGEECTTKGQIFANGHRREEHTGQYLRSLGYCPQFFGLDEFQTGRENLALLLTLRGLDAEDVHAEVKAWINVVGLQKYSSRVVSGYSGGCMRRLAAAAALASGAPLTLLDEPTSGVDVSARRRVWAALRRGLKHDRAVIITSHSMDEMEALCSNIAIMSGGQVRALGSAAALRARHAAGHALLLKLRRAPAAGPTGAAGSADEVDSSVKGAVDQLKGKMHESFACTLKDEHKTMLHYHINETLRYSDLFRLLENLKNEFSELVEDYSITETTLEEVFLSFAKEHHNGPATV